MAAIVYSDEHLASVQRRFIGNSNSERMQDLFSHIAHRISGAVGSPWAFSLATLAVIIWAVTGPIFHYSDTWQLIINTGTTVLTFLIVFLIQNSQNRESHAINLKLDELIKAIDPARNALIDIEEEEQDKLDELQEEFKKFRESKSQQKQPRT